MVTTMTTTTAATSLAGSASSASSLGSGVFVFLNMQQFIKGIILIGDIGNEYVTSFLQSGFNLDGDLIPKEYFPSIKIRN